MHMPSCRGAHPFVRKAREDACTLEPPHCCLEETETYRDGAGRGAQGAGACEQVLRGRVDRVRGGVHGAVGVGKGDTPRGDHHRDAGRHEGARRGSVAEPHVGGLRSPVVMQQTLYSVSVGCAVSGSGVRPKSVALFAAAVCDVVAYQARQQREYVCLYCLEEIQHLRLRREYYCAVRR